MDCDRVFSSILERKEGKYVFWGLLMSYGINYEIYNKNTKFSELIGFIYVQLLFRDEKTTLIGLAIGI